MQHVLRFTEEVNLNLTAAKGCMLYDDQGTAYLDLEAGTWSAALGHNHPAVNQTIQAQLGKISHLGTRYPNQTVEQAAQDVLSITDMPDGQCIFLSSGSEAVEFAVQSARRIAAHPLQLCLSNTYLAAYGSSSVKESTQWVILDWKTCETCTQTGSSCATCPTLTNLPFDQIGTFVFESGSFSGQVKFPPQALISEIARQIKQNDGLIVVNEITTGMGRTGKWFGYQHYNLQPDLVAIGKGLGNGYPVSAVAVTAKTAEALKTSGFLYAQSHQNDPLGAAVASTVIRTMQEEDTLAHCAVVGTFLKQQLEQLKTAFPIILQVRGRGLLIGLELVSPEAAEAVYTQLFQRGFLCGFKKGSPMLRFFPPLTIQESELLPLCQVLRDIFADFNDGFSATQTKS